MPLFVPKTLLQAAQGGAQTKRYRDFVIAYFEGEGAIAVPNPIWQPAASWAGGRQPSGNRMRDRGLLLQRLDVLVTRRGTTVTSTTGGMIPLARLRNAMKSEGVDIKEWNFPPDDVLDKALDPDSGKEQEEQAAVADEGPGHLTRLDPQRVRSSKGFEVRMVDQYTAEYRDGELCLAVRGVPGVIGGRQTFQVRSRLVISGAQPAGEAQGRLWANFTAAMEALGFRLA
jgi:hypothetical protein